jgi:hypothetical protein
MQDGVPGILRGGGGSFAKQLAGNVEKGKAPLISSAKPRTTLREINIKAIPKS